MSGVLLQTASGGLGGYAGIRRIAIDIVSVALAEPCAVRSVLSDHLHVKMLAEVELSDEAFATVTLVLSS